MTEMTCREVPTVEELEAHRERLSFTLRKIAYWRYQQSFREGLSRNEKKAQLRAELSLRRLANFVDELSIDDPDLRNFFHCEVTLAGRVDMTRAAFHQLSRFGMNIGAWQQGGGPAEAQMRNILRRANGHEQRARAAARAEESSR
jgi:hypothetical protein